MTILLVIIILGAMALLGGIAYFFYGLARAEKEHRDKHDGRMM